MTHTVVTRVALAVCAFCVGAALLFAYLASTPASYAEAQSAPTKSEPHPGQALYDRHCAGCHTIDEAEGMLKVGGPNLDANAKTMVEFLKSHGRASDPEDVAIVAFIRGRVK